MEKKHRIISDGLYLVVIAVAFILLVLLSAFADAGPRVFKKGARVGEVIAVAYPHHKVHECKSFSTVFNNASLGNGGKLQLILNTPASTPTDDKDIHILIVARGSSEGRYEIWKNPTITAIGTPMREENRNQTCTNVAEMEVTHTPTITNAGEHLSGFDQHFGAGQSVGGESRGLNVIVLDNNTTYFINGVSEAASNDFTLEPDWFEDNGMAP